MPPISVSISRKKVLLELNKQRNKLRRMCESHQRARASYEKARKQWQKTIVPMVAKALRGGVNVVHVDAGASVRLDVSEVTIRFPLEKLRFPPAPKIVPISCAAADKLQQIENAIRLLEMSADKSVVTSAYESICALL